MNNESGFIGIDKLSAICTYVQVMGNAPLGTNRISNVMCNCRNTILFVKLAIYACYFCWNYGLNGMYVNEECSGIEGLTNHNINLSEWTPYL